MKICDIVYNSIWYDPRVKKQITSYISNNFKVIGIGIEDNKANYLEIKKFDCDIILIKQKKNLCKLFKTVYYIKSICDAIVNSNPEIIHANDILALFPAYIAFLRLYKKPVLIYDSHEICALNYTTSRITKLRISNYIKKWLIEISEKHIIKRLDCFICVSHAAWQYFNKKYQIGHSLIITNSVKFNKEITKNKKYPEKNRPFIVLIHGLFGANRGYDTMVEAAKISQIKRKNIQFIARGYGNLDKFIRNKIIEYELNNFCVEPPVNVSQLVIKARSADIGVAITLPVNLNYKLSVSNKLFEYAAAGLPVIMSDIPEHRYLNKKFNFGIIIRENSANCLLNAVTYLIDNEDFYEQCSKNAVKMINELDWEKEFGKLIAIEIDAAEKKGR